jgi:hypothetical protein
MSEREHGVVELRSDAAHYALAGVGAPPNLARRCSTGASRRFFYLANSAAGRSMALVLFELPGRCTSAPAAIERAGGWRRRAFALRFPAGGMARPRRAPTRNTGALARH